jgi:hypothetical protein
MSLKQNFEMNFEHLSLILGNKSYIREETVILGAAFTKIPDTVYSHAFVCGLE